MKTRFDWRRQYDVARDEAEGALAAIECVEPTLTQQQFKDDADLNVLVKRFGLDKITLPSLAMDPKYYGDVSDVPDLRTVLDIANEARNRFMDLPAELRSRFHNSPAELWEFVNDPVNAEASVKLGLLHRPPPAPEEPVESAVAVPEGNAEA